ncbi:uncharacterized mitochondrial protein-like protein [Tanacetum coccineum]
MSEKEKDPEAIKQNISHKPIDYEKLNRLYEDFGKRFTPQKELAAEQAFWFRIYNPTIESSNISPVKVEVPSELPKVSLVNASLKKLKFHLAQFDSVVKKRTTHDARTKGEWGFEHTKAVFNNEIIPFLKSLKDIFNVFNKDLLNEIMEVQTIFDQMEAVVQQSSVDEQCLEIAKKELLLENDRILQQIMSQDVLLTMMNSTSLIGESVNMERKINESCYKCFNLDAELWKSQNAHNDLLKKYFENNDLKAQLQDKDTTICKLKEIIKSMRENSKEENVNYDYCEIETKNVELENSMAKLLSKNERLCKEINYVKQVFKDQPDSIKKTRVRTKEQNDSLIDKLNLKSAENEDLKAQIQDKVFVITSLKNDFTLLKAQKEMNFVDIALHKYHYKPTMVHEFKQAKAKLAFSNALTLLYRTPGLPSEFTEFTRMVGLNEPLRITQATFKLGRVIGEHQIPNTPVLSPTGLKCSTTNVVPPKKTTSDSVETQKPELKVYSRKPKNVKNIGSSKKAKIVEYKNANNSEPNHTWGSNAIDIPSSSSLVMIVRFENNHIAKIMGFFKTKDEAPEAIIKCIKNMKGRLNATVRNVRTNNGTEFVNQTLREFYENVGISHQTSVARTPQQNDVVERRN